MQQRWQLADATVAALHGWQPSDEPSCVLEGVEAVALGREAQPAVRWWWRQGDTRLQAQLTVLDLIEAMADEEDLEPPDASSPARWVALIRLSVFEPHEAPPGAPPGRRWCLDHLP